MTSPYNPLPNDFRRRLLAGERLFGCWLSLASHAATEVVGYAGFNWVLLDGEHAPNDLGTLVVQLMALAKSPSAPIVRPQWNDTVLIKRLLDVGFTNFIVPFIETEAQARAAVAATRYPPQGVRGIALAHRGNRFGYEPDYYARVNDHIGVIVQIESRAGVEASVSIAAVDGVDCLFVGPSDLSASLGHPGHPNHAEVQEAISTVIANAKAQGKPVGILAFAEDDIRRYLDQGVTFVAIGSDVGLLRNASKALADKYGTT